MNNFKCELFNYEWKKTINVCVRVISSDLRTYKTDVIKIKKKNIKKKIRKNRRRPAALNNLLPV